jgi:hypothetical protein
VTPSSPRETERAITQLCAGANGADGNGAASVKRHAAVFALREAFSSIPGELNALQMRNDRCVFARHFGLLATATIPSWRNAHAACKQHAVCEEAIELFVYQIGRGLGCRAVPQYRSAC